MMRIADLYAYLCQSLEVQGANNGKSAYDDVIVLCSPRKIQIEEIVNSLENYRDYKNILIEPSNESLGWIYFRQKSTRDIVGGVCVTQHKEVLTMIFGDTAFAPEEDVVNTE